MVHADYQFLLLRACGKDFASLNSLGQASYVHLRLIINLPTQSTLTHTITTTLLL